ncbi:MAG: hypothetical protein Q9187_009248, partial [Circinaria calcarea]
NSTTTMTTTTTTISLPPSYTLALSNHVTAKTLSTSSASSPTSPQPPLFVYGSLMLPSLLARIINAPVPASRLALQMTPAILRGHARCAVREADYPAVVVMDAGGSGGGVSGFLVLGLTRSQRENIHHFESGLYDLTRVTVEVEVLDDEASGTGNNEQGEIGGNAGEEREVPKRKEKIQVAAEAYVWGGDRSELVESVEKAWTFEGFLASGMARLWEEEEEEEEVEEEE